MSKPLTVDIFVEDRAHEAFMVALVGRLAAEVQRAVQPRVRAARGGHGRALTELELYQQNVSPLHGITPPDVLVIAIDSNCRSYQQARRDIQSRLQPAFEHMAVIACPDPHVEAWYLADPDSFRPVVGSYPSLKRGKCVRGYYKRALAKAVADGGHPPTLGGIEFASEIVAQMDLYRAGRRHRSLMRAIEDVRNLLGRGEGP